MKLFIIPFLIIFPALGGFTSNRVITIDHTQVGTVNNTDQSSFPYLFTTVCDVLNGSINNSTTTITVTYGKCIQNGDYVLLDTEIVLCTAGGGTVNLTCTRAQKSTSAASHTSGATATNEFLGPSSIGGTVTNTSGFDIIFTTDTSCNQRLDFERDSYVSATGAAWFWIRIPTLSHTTDQVLYVCYNNSAITTDQANPFGVWDTNYVFVSHCNYNNSAHLPPVADATSYRSDLVTAGSAPVVSASQIANGLNMAGGGIWQKRSYVTYSMLTLPTGANTPWSLDAWINIATGVVAAEEIVGWGANTGNGNRWAIFYTSSTIGAEVSGGTALSAFVPNTAWHHIAIALASGQNNLSATKVYIDGVATTPTAGSITMNVAGSGEFIIGAIPAANGSNNYTEKVDEVRASSTERSADWYKTSYNNQSTPGNFATLSVAATPTVPGGGNSASVQ